LSYIAVVDNLPFLALVRIVAFGIFSQKELFEFPG